MRPDELERESLVRAITTFSDAIVSLCHRVAAIEERVFAPVNPEPASKYEPVEQPCPHRVPCAAPCQPTLYRKVRS